MATIKQIIARLELFTRAIDEGLLYEILKREENFVLDLNRSQLLHGVDANGSKLRKYQSKSYAKFKKRLNPRGVTDLKLTGRFHGMFYYKTTSFPIEISSRDSKTSLLIENYGKDVFGLTDKSKRTLRGVVRKKQNEARKRFLKLRNY